MLNSSGIWGTAHFDPILIVRLHGFYVIFKRIIILENLNMALLKTIEPVHNSTKNDVTLAFKGMYIIQSELGCSFKF